MKNRKEMKKIYCLCLACLLVSVVAAQSVKELYIFHTNDMHSRIEPFASYFPDTVLAGKAGGFCERTAP